MFIYPASAAKHNKQMCIKMSNNLFSIGLFHPPFNNVSSIYHATAHLLHSTKQKSIWKQKI